MEMKKMSNKIEGFNAAGPFSDPVLRRMLVRVLPVV
jgi:hypothetical protein